ncbi:MAG: histidine kinase [Bacteroidota bacterium]
MNIKFTEGDSLFDFPVGELPLIASVFILVLGVWEGNKLIGHFVYGNPDPKYQYGPLIKHFLISIVWVLALSFAGSMLISLFFEVPSKVSEVKLMIGFTFRITLFLHCINAINYYRKQGNDYQIEAERFKKESAEAQFDALRKQINPHFLFNSFNVLSTLVYQNADTAAKFIDQLSQVYRYLLKNQDNRLVKLNEELDFLQAYIYLMKIRFQENLRIENKIDAQSNHKYIAPAALQLLIENAIKHNEVSKRSPLTISLYNMNGHLVVENNIQLKDQQEESSNVGLNNIINRYSFISKEDPVIVKTDDKFTVKIPLINVEE